MADDSAPLVRLDQADAAKAPSLSYNVPDPTSYPGRSYITLDFGEHNPFRTEAVVSSAGRAVVPFHPAVTPGMGARPTATPSRRPPSVRLGGTDFGPIEVLTSGDVSVPVRELLDSGVIGFEPAPDATRFTILAPITRSSRMIRSESGTERLPDGGQEPDDPPEPRAVLQIVSPVEGAVFEAGPNGFDLQVRVRVTYRNTVTLPGSITVTINGTNVSAARVASPATNIREYSASRRVQPGTATISARVTLDGILFTTLAARQVQVNQVQPGQQDASPPSLTLDTPTPGVNLVLGASGEVTLELRGRAVDPDSAVSACTVSLDGGSPAPVALSNDGGFSHRLTVASEGDHQLVVRATNAANLSSELTRFFSVTAGPRIPRHRLMLVECLRLSNYLGRYGAGRIVQTFSLLPGEKTSITIRSFESTTTAATETSSIFDSFSETTGDELTSAVTNEDTTKSQNEEELKTHVNVKAGASWGFGSASVEAGLAYGTSSAREQLTKNVTNGASRHAAEKSSKRDVKVDTTRTVTSQTQNEQTIVRTLENTNLSRTLNFVFRQMTQEFVSLLHLVDIRVAHMTEWFNLDGSRVTVAPDPAKPDVRVPLTDYEEVALPQLHGLLQRVCVSQERAAIAEAIILRQFDAVFDYRGERQAIVQEVSREVPSRDPLTGQIRTEPDPNDPTGRRPVMERVVWTRFDPDLRGTWPPADPQAPPAGFSVTVPGVILGVTENTLRTDGIVVDAFLGGGPALDAYSTELQRTAIATREAEAEQAEAEVARTQLGVEIVTAGDASKADLYARVFVPPPEPRPSELGLDGSR